MTAVVVYGYGFEAVADKRCDDDGRGDDDGPAAA